MPRKCPHPSRLKHTVQDRYMFLCSLCQILTHPSKFCSRNWNSWDQKRVFTCYCKIFVSSCELETKFSALSWQECCLVCSSAAVTRLLQCWMFCTFTDALLHTLVLMSGYLSYCCLPGSLKCTGHSPISGINTAFSPRKLHLNGYFHLFS